MSKYGVFAKKIDAALRIANSEYVSAYQRKIEADEKKEKASYNLSHFGNSPERDLAYRIAEIESEKADNDFRSISRNAWNCYRDTVAQIDRECREQIEQDYHLIADDINDGIVKLLDSHLLTASDMSDIAKNANTTMRRIIARYAHGEAVKAAASGDREKHSAFTMVCKDCGGDKETVISEWDNLMHCAKIYSGNGHGGAEHNGVRYVLDMNNRWFDMADTIENF